MRPAKPCSKVLLCRFEATDALVSVSRQISRASSLIFKLVWKRLGGRRVSGFQRSADVVDAFCRDDAEFAQMGTGRIGDLGEFTHGHRLPARRLDHVSNLKTAGEGKGPRARGARSLGGT